MFIYILHKESYNHILIQYFPLYCLLGFNDMVEKPRKHSS